jgi:hypothetical protein
VTKMWALNDAIAGKPVDVADDMFQYALGDRVGLDGDSQVI